MSMLRVAVDESGNFIRPVTLCGPSLALQSEADACDINNIMARYEKTGVLQHVQKNPGFYDDVSQVPDYQAALDVVRKADDMFSSLPAALRQRFDNDPSVYLQFVSNPANKDELVKLGLMKAPPEKVTVPLPPEVKP